jgi:hypothetical protein
MKLPGFTAEASVGPTTQVYRVQDRNGPAALSDVYPQSDGVELDEGLDDESLDDEGLSDEEDDEVGDEM